VPTYTEHRHSAKTLAELFQAEKTLLVKGCLSHLVGSRSICTFAVFIWSFEMDQQNLYTQDSGVHNYVQ